MIVGWKSNDSTSEAKRPSTKHSSWEIDSLLTIIRPEDLIQFSEQLAMKYNAGERMIQPDLRSLRAGLCKAGFCQRPGTVSTTPLECGSGSSSRRRGTIREPCSAPPSSSRYCASELTRHRS